MVPRPILFVAREPDETLRTFLPIVDELHRRSGPPSRMLFHHWPGPWAREQLADRGVPWWHVPVPYRVVTSPEPRPGSKRRARAAAEVLGQLRAVRNLAREVIDTERPSMVIVIQDTLLLERFLVRWANRRGIPTLVVQWAFNFPQSYYDRLRAVRPEAAPPQTARAGWRGALTGGAFRALMGLGDVQFHLVNSYGGGEAHLFAVMGEHFADQYRAQGVRDKRIVVTGHPLHDAAYRQAQTLDTKTLSLVRDQYGIDANERVILYATQPFFWRGVLTPDELQANVRAMNAAAADLGPNYRLTVKIHPRESAADYSFCATLSPVVRVVEQAEMARLIALADVFVSSSSSTVLLAMMLDRPIVTVNFNAVPHFDFYAGLGGTLHVQTHTAFGDALKLAAADEPTRARLAEERRAVLQRLARFDGQCAARLADLVHESIAQAESAA